MLKNLTTHADRENDLGLLPDHQKGAIWNAVSVREAAIQWKRRATLIAASLGILAGCAAFTGPLNSNLKAVIYISEGLLFLMFIATGSIAFRLSQKYKQHKAVVETYGFSINHVSYDVAIQEIAIPMLRKQKWDIKE